MPAPVIQGGISRAKTGFCPVLTQLNVIDPGSIVHYQVYSASLPQLEHLIADRRDAEELTLKGHAAKPRQLHGRRESFIEGPGRSGPLSFAESRFVLLHSPLCSA
jgi:hypothetical protein